jgi:hypothetical protein
MTKIMKVKLDLTQSHLKDLAQGIRLIPSNKNSDAESDISLWYQGNEPYFDIFLSIKNNKLFWFQVTFRGRFIELKNNQLTSGSTNEYMIDPDDHAPSSKMLSPEVELDIGLLKIIHSILEQRKEVDPLRNIGEILGKYLK